MKNEQNVSLARYTSLHVGGPAHEFIRVTTDDELIEALDYATNKQLPFFTLGSGSNTLFSDSGFAGVVIHMEDRRLAINGPTVTAASGVFMRQLVNVALGAGLRGLESLAGIPGTVGGSVRGNAGTWNTEIKDVLTGVEVLKPHKATWRLKAMPVLDCEFGYRDSIFKRQPTWVIVRAHFQLTPGDPKEGERLVQEDMRKRRARQPYDAPSAGSIFKNPDKSQQLFAGSLIEQAGLKGMRIGGAEISAKHANFIVNRQSATAADVRALIQKAQQEVRQTAHVNLEPEIVIVE